MSTRNAHVMENDHVMEAPTEHNQSIQAESLPCSSNQHLGQSESDRVSQSINHERDVQLKRLILRCKHLLERSQDSRLYREENLLLYDELRTLIFSPEDVWTSSLDILENSPLIWTAYKRGKHDYSKSKTLLTKRPTLEPALAKIAKFPRRITKLGFKMFLSKQKMTNQKFMEDFYQFLLSKPEKKKQFH